MDKELNLKDLEFVKSLDSDLANIIYDICNMNITDMLNAMNHPDNQDDAYLKAIKPNKLEEMVVFYSSMLDLYIDAEKYEECKNLKIIIESLNKYSNKVATNQ